LNFSRIVAGRRKNFKHIAAIVAFIFIYRHLNISNALFTCAFVIPEKRIEMFARALNKKLPSRNERNEGRYHVALIEYRTPHKGVLSIVPML
jgi:hypothetical protein